VIAPAAHSHQARFSLDGHQSAVAALLLVPATLVWMGLLMPVGWGLQRALGLDETQMLTEGGGRGVVAFVLILVVSAVPPIVGAALGMRARRLGARRLGTTGVAANAVVGAGFVLSPILQALFA
jgi:hypothetical protein